jgi:hypothetical protein
MFGVVERPLLEGHALPGIFPNRFRNEHAGEPLHHFRQLGQTIPAVPLASGVVVDCGCGVIIDQEIGECDHRSVLVQREMEAQSYRLVD